MTQTNPDRKLSTPRAQTGGTRKKNSWVLVLLCLPFLLAFYLIFHTGNEGTSQRVGGILLSIPDGREQQIEGDKQKAIEQELRNEKESERVRTLAESTFSLKEDTLRQAKSGQGRNQIVQSQSTYRDLQAEVKSFYAPAATRPPSEVTALRRQVDELRAELEAKEQKHDPLEYMERSYALASKYLGGQPQAELQPPAPPDRKGMRVRRTADNTVSALTSPMSDSAFAAAYGKARNYGFNTAVGEAVADNRNAIRACIDCDQVVRSGEVVRLRLLEPMQVDRYVLAANAVVWGVAGVGGQRLSIQVSSIESGGNIIPVRLRAHDLDGQEGLNIPGSLERDALKNAAASIGSSLGQSITFTRNASQQVAMDVSRGVMAGGTQYLSDKLREVKITLKANYKLLLISQE